MEKTQFAGISVLGPGESVTDDGGAFTGQDRRIIDRLLELGAKTHRHNGLPGLLNPNQAMGASAVASAGTLPGALAFAVGYSLTDEDGGETLISPLVTLSTPPQIGVPLFAPTVTADYTAGDLLADTFYYAKSWVDATGGETPLGPATPGEREPGFPNGRMLVTDLDDGMSGAGAAAWRLYRAVGGGDFHYLASGVGAAFTDDGAQSVNCDIEPLPSNVNTTNGANSLILRLPSGDARVAEAAAINVYLSEDGSFSGNSFLAAYPVASAGASVVFNAITLTNAQPPDTNNSIGGASQIDPDTDLLDWHWRRAVTASGQLGSGTSGDVKLIKDNGFLYAVLGSGAADGPGDWVRIASGGVVASGGGGGGGGASGISVFDGTTSTLYEGVYEFDMFGFDIDFAIDPGTPGILAITPTGGGGASGCVKATYNYTTGSIADAATEDGFVDTSAVQNANVISVLSLVVDNECRVRLYASAADQTADSARPFGTDPTGDHGVLLDVEIGSALTLRINPATLLYTSDGSSNFYISVENMSGGTTAVSVDLNSIAVVAP